MPAKHFLICCLLWAAPAFGWAQKYLIDLSAQQLVLPTSQWNVVKVIDARADQKSIGWVLKGYYKEQTLADLKNGVEATLLTITQRSQVRVPSAKPVVLRLTQLLISEQMYTRSEAATVELGLECWYEEAGQYYLLGQATEVVRSGNLDATYQHADNISAALGKCLNQLLTKPMPANLPPAHAWAQLAETVSSEGDAPYPVQTAGELRRGVYHNYLQFRNNAPDENNAAFLQRELVSRHEIITEGRPYLVAGKNEHFPLRNAWGFSDGERAFVYFQYKYYALEKTPNGFQFAGPYIPNAEESTEQAATVAAVGLLGNAMVGKKLPKYAMYELDMYTGQVVNYGSKRLNSELAALRAQPTTIVVYRRGSATVAPVAVRVNNQEVLTLAANQYVTVPCSANGEVEVCVGTTTCLRLKPTASVTTYIEYHGEQANPAALRAVPSSLAEVHVRKLTPAGE
jgi:hypothetical protein